MRTWPLVPLALMCLSAPAVAQEDLDLESWIVIEEEAAPEPPFLRAHVGFVGWVENQTRLQVDKDFVQGTRLDNMEEEHGLNSSGFGPWLELTLGGKVRGGVDVTWVPRGGSFETQEEDIFFDGTLVAQSGDLLRSEFSFLTAAGFVEWDVLYGRNYRIGLLGGARYFRFDADLRGISTTTNARTTAAATGELFSPFFGGLIELIPFPYFSVFVRAQFMNWSWEEINLKEARFFEFRLGTTVRPIPDRLGIGVEFRFLSMRAEGREAGDPDSLEVALGATGLVFTVNLAF